MIVLNRTNAPTDWNAYRKARNLVNSKLEVAHCDYQRHLFDELFTGSKRQFWKYIRSMRRDSTGIPTLFSDEKEFNTARDKASVLNNHFQSVFTSEDLSNIPSYYRSVSSSYATNNYYSYPLKE